jgi:hypothetical protein
MAFELKRVSISGGGVKGASGSFILWATVGENGPVSNAKGGGSIRLGEGFWPGYEVASTVDVMPGDVTTVLVSALGHNLPNPFYGSTSISFTLAQPSSIRMIVYDVAGRQVSILAKGVVPSGSHRVEWMGRDDSGRPVTAGIYLCRLEVGTWSQTRKMIKLR